MEWIHLPKLFIPGKYAQFKSSVQNPSLLAQFEGKFQEEWEKKRLSHAFSEYNKISVLAGEDWSRQGRCGFVLACEEYQASARAGSRLHPRGFISATWTVIWVRGAGLWASAESAVNTLRACWPASGVGFLSFCLTLSPIGTQPRSSHLAAFRGNPHTP